jgi:hypothetical protein
VDAQHDGRPHAASQYCQVAKLWGWTLICAAAAGTTITHSFTCLPKYFRNTIVLIWFIGSAICCQAASVDQCGR